MIIEFSLANYRSFNEMQTISFKATGLVSEDPIVDINNTIEEGKTKYLKIVGLYGANGSGKSNLIKGLSFLRDLVANSLEMEGITKRGLNQFKLSNSSKENAGFFQIIFITQGRKYRYGFTLHETGNIQKEWLYGPADKNETFYFKRSEDGIVNSNQEFFPEGIALPADKLRSDVLFLTFCASYDGVISRAIKDYITNNITVDRNASSVRTSSAHRRHPTDELISKDGKKDLVLLWMKEAGLLYNDVDIKFIEIAKDLTYKQILFLKSSYNHKGEISGNVEFDLQRDESAGTKKFYDYIGRLYKLFNEGGVFISDEIDSNFHPSLLRKLLSLFQKSSINIAGAQLLFTSHDTNLMKPSYMRRDQFYFSEKSIYEDTKLYSLSDLKGIRNNADFANQYLSGFYGALPQLGNHLEEASSNS